MIPTPIPIPIFPPDPLSRTRTATATFAPIPSPSPNVPQQTYIVEAGDSPFKIAQKVYGDGTKYPLILKANNLNENSRLNAGMILKIPPLAVSPTAFIPNSPTPTGIPTATAITTKTAPPTEPVSIGTPKPTIALTREASFVPGAPSTDEAAAIMVMLMNLASATLVGSSFVCGLLSFAVYTSTRRVESQHEMARRVRPPMVR